MSISRKHQFTGIAFCLSLFLTNAGFARDSIEISTNNDFEAPDILHNTDTDISRDKQGNVMVSAKVTDEFSVNSVTIYFRDSNSNKYRSRPMSLDNDRGQDVYIVRIPSNAISGERIEYYFEADDKVGNKKLKGLEFSPLRRLLSDLAIKNGETETLAKTNSAEKDPVSSALELDTPVVKPDQPIDSIDFPMVWMPGL
ncbi:MAG: hypothetical protein OEZ43_14285 [Gammaproteobacteria bacterium]|nr:hypothetical protein [Gammaproteobacteria bacterium]